VRAHLLTTLGVIGLFAAALAGVVTAASGLVDLPDPVVVGAVAVTLVGLAVVAVTSYVQAVAEGRSFWAALRETARAARWWTGAFF
jgi:hypothetical protein